METTDILIIGGGPAGLSTALHLQQSHPDLVTSAKGTHRILILEKERYPRPKLCAGGLVTDAEILLQRLGLDVTEIPHVDASAAHFDFAGKGLTVKVPRRHTLRIIRRDEFDAWLAEKTKGRGIEIREQVTVTDVRPEADSVTVVTAQGDFRAKIVVGADGSNGITRRCVLPNAPVYTARLLEIITPSQPPPIPLNLGEVPRHGQWESKREGVAYFDFFPVPDGIAGYVWDFPTQVKGQPMRCWGVFDSNLSANTQRPALQQPLADEMKRHGFELGDYKLQGHPIRWYDPSNHLSVPRVLLVGDAAGADPLFGEGISIALGYGKLAAIEIGQAFEREDFSFSGYRQRARLSSLGRTLLARWVIAQFIYIFRWRWFQILLWRVLKPIVLTVAWLLVLNWGKRLK